MRTCIRVGAVAWVVALVCAGCGSYFTPYADLVLHVADVRDEASIREVLATYAQRRQWDAYPAANDSPAPDSARRINARTTNYLSGGPEGKGRSLTLFDATANCKVVRLVERSRDWNDDSERDLRELQAALGRIAGLAVTPGARYPGNGAAAEGRAITDYCPGWEQN